MQPETNRRNRAFAPPALLGLLLLVSSAASSGCGGEAAARLSEGAQEAPDPEAGGGEQDLRADSLGITRAKATASLLPNGMVALLGGHTDGGYSDGGSGPVSTHSGFDPTVQVLSDGGFDLWRWVSLPSLGTAREEHSATTLADGRVLVVGGRILDGGVTSSAVAFNPQTLLWETATYVSGARRGHTATQLLNGEVLVCGGYNVSAVPLASCSLYNPLTQSWRVIESMTTARANHTATLLRDGGVVVIGGRAASANSLASAEVIRPRPDGGFFWAPVGSLAAPRQHHQAVLLENGKVLVVGGRAVRDGGVGTALASAELYGLAPDGGGGFSDGGAMSAARSLHSATRLRNGNVLVLGGLGGADGGPLASADLFYGSTSSFRSGGLQKANGATLLFDPRAGHTATELQDGRVLVAAGFSVPAGELRTAEVVSVSRPTILGFQPTGVVNCDRRATPWKCNPVDLVYSVMGADTCSLGGAAVKPLAGSVTVSPQSTQPFTLTCANEAGSVSETTSVSVSFPDWADAGEPTIISTFLAGPSPVAQGAEVTVSYQVDNAPDTGCAITGRSAPTQLTRVLDPSGGPTRVLRGSFTATVPTVQTETWVLSCGATSAQTQVKVVAGSPIIRRFWASESRLWGTRKARLSWVVDRAASCSLSPSAGVTLPFAGNGAVNQVEVQPTRDTEYRLTCSNTAGSASARALVTVVSAGLEPTLTLTASASTVDYPAGGTVDVGVTFAFADAARCELITSTNGTGAAFVRDAFSAASVPNPYTLTKAIDKSTTFTGRCWGAGGKFVTRVVGVTARPAAAAPSGCRTQNTKGSLPLGFVAVEDYLKADQLQERVYPMANGIRGTLRIPKEKGLYAVSFLIGQLMPLGIRARHFGIQYIDPAVVAPCQTQRLTTAGPLPPEWSDQCLNLDMIRWSIGGTGWDEKTHNIAIGEDPRGAYEMQLEGRFYPIKMGPNANVADQDSWLRAVIYAAEKYKRDFPKTLWYEAIADATERLDGNSNSVARGMLLMLGNEQTMLPDPLEHPGASLVARYADTVYLYPLLYSVPLDPARVALTKPPASTGPDTECPSCGDRPTTCGGPVSSCAAVQCDNGTACTRGEDCRSGRCNATTRTCDLTDCQFNNGCWKGSWGSAGAPAGGSWAVYFTYSPSTNTLTGSGSITGYPCSIGIGGAHVRGSVATGCRIDWSSTGCVGATFNGGFSSGAGGMGGNWRYDGSYFGGWAGGHQGGLAPAQCTP